MRYAGEPSRVLDRLVAQVIGRVNLMSQTSILFWRQAKLLPNFVENFVYPTQKTSEVFATSRDGFASASSILGFVAGNTAGPDRNRHQLFLELQKKKMIT